MSKRVRNHAPYLRVLARGTTKQRQGIIQGANRELVHCLCECALNVLNGNIPLKPAEKRKLKKYKHHLRTLGAKKNKFVEKEEGVAPERGFPRCLTDSSTERFGRLVV